MKLIRSYKQKGFVLFISMTFLIIMTLLALTAIQRASLDEKVSANLRAQTLAFQAAEQALRACQRSLEQTGPGGSLPLLPGTTQTFDGTPIHQYPATNASGEVPPPPSKWKDKASWSGADVRTLNAGTVPNVASQPQCMIEEYPIKDDLKPKVYTAYVITSRGVGATNTAVVWLQETLRVGNDVK